MEILAICGSPRGEESNTLALTKEFLAEAEKLGASVRVADLSKLSVGWCTSCGDCHRGPICTIDDDGPALLKQMMSADGILLATPNYINHLSAQLKAVLDRSNNFIHCLHLYDKYLAALSTSGGGPGSAIADFIRAYGVLTGAQFVGSAHAPLPLNESHYSAARKLAADMVEAIASKKQWSDQVSAIQAQKEFFARNIAAHKDEWPYEYSYWQKKGWL